MQPVMAQQTELSLPDAWAWRFDNANGGAYKHMQLSQDPLATTDLTSLPPETTIIKVLSASLNPVDVKVAETPIFGRIVQPLPAVPGSDACGIVVASSDPTLQKGQVLCCRVKEHSAVGVMSTYAVIHGRETYVPVPDGVVPLQAATVGTCGVTAIQAFQQRFKLDDMQQGKRVLVNGGSGGMGVFEIQIAKTLGCYVTATSSAKNMEFCRDLGADEVLDYAAEPLGTTLAKRAEGHPELAYDLVLDNTNSNAAFYRASNKFLNKDGVFVQVSNDVSWKEAKEALEISSWPGILGGGCRRWVFLRMTMNRSDASRVLHWMAEGKIKVPIGLLMEFEDVPEAYKRLCTQRTTGKIVVKMPAFKEWERHNSARNRL